MERGTQNLVSSRNFWALAHLPMPTLLAPLPWLTTSPSSLCLPPTLSPWMVARSVWTMQANLPGAPEEGVLLGPMDVVAATLEVSTKVRFLMR